MTTDVNNTTSNTTDSTRLSASIAEAPDQELLELYVSTGSRAALTQIIERYGPLVATVCQTTVADQQAAEDAFQATFLVLIKSANKIQRRDSLGSWLYGVAYRTAVRVRKQVRKSQQQLALDLDEQVESRGQNETPVYELARKIELDTLSNELQRMPDTLRCVLIEHYFLGHSAPAIADRLDLSTSAVEGRLRRGRRALRQRLARRGVSMSIVLAACGYLQKTVAAGESGWGAEYSVDAIISTSSSLASDAATQAGPQIANPTVSSLVSKELSMLTSATGKLALASLVTLAAGVTMFTMSQIGVAQQGSGSNSGGQTAVLDGQTDSTTAYAKMPRPDAAETTLAQFGNAAPGNIGAAPNAQTPPPNIPAPGQNVPTAQNQAQAIAPNSPAAVGAAGAGRSEARDVAWQRPDDSELPTWLTARDPRAKAITSNRERLSTTIQADFTGVSLATALMTIGDSIDAPIWIHEQELDALGIDSDVPIRLSIGRELTAQTALDLILKPLDLSYRVGEVIEVTSIDALNAEPDLRLYDLSYILPNSSNSDAMLNAIQQSIDADNWLAAGGESCITLVGSMMVVSAPYTTQCEIEQFLAKFMRMNPENARQSPASSTPMYGMGGGMGGMGGGMGMGMGGGMF